MRGRRLAAVAALVVGGLLPTAATTPVRAAATVGPAVLSFGDAPALPDPSALRPNKPVVGMAATPTGGGYWLVASDGGIFAFGDAGFFGSAGGIRLNRPIVGMAATPTGRGYWLVASDGGIFSYGDAAFFGSTGGMRLNRPVVGMAATPTGSGYWLVASDGGIFAFGDAAFFGSTGGMRLNRPVVGMAATPTGRGYWLVASDGGIFAFGDAAFFGSTGGMRLNRPVVGMAAAPGGDGYWLVATDGGIFSFGAARFHGSTGSLVLNRPIVSMAPTPGGDGYWLVASDGGIFAFGAAGFFGSGVGALGAGRVATGIVASPGGRGYTMLAVPAAVRVGFGGDVHGVGRVGTTLASGANPLDPMRPLFAENDVNVVNLETAVGSDGAAQDKQYVFQSPVSLLTALRAAGVGVVNLANNHSLDFGPAGLLETIANARAAGLLVVGAGADAASAYAPAVIATPGGTVAVLGLSQVVPAGWAAGAGHPGVASVYDLGAATNAIRAAHAVADRVVVVIHWGIEETACPTALQRSTAAALVQAGADVVAGGHPHELQGISSIGRSVVAYSLGNFVWYDNSPPNDLTGLLTVELSDAGAVTSFAPARIDTAGRPVPLSGAAADAASALVASLAPGAGRC